MDRILAVWKQKGPTSHDIVDKVRKITGVRKVGHAGTLDPLASGVLVVGVGRGATKKLGGIVKKEKEYEATVRLGETSTTDDEEGKKEITNYQLPITSDQLQNVVNRFVGRIKQVPPVYSAIKVDGKKAYKEARAGRPMRLEPREVEIKDIEIQSYKWPILKLRVVTGPGVYVRALARDIGEKLGTGGYLADLVRTRVGDFTKEDSVTLDDLKKIPKISPR